MTTHLNKSQQVYSLGSSQHFASTAPARALPQLHDEHDDDYDDDAEDFKILTWQESVCIMCTVS